MRNSKHRHPLVQQLASIVLLVSVTATTLGQEQDKAKNPSPPNPFPDRPAAPSLDGGVEWLNCGGPIGLPDLRGKVVLLDFWTYCCINCIHVLPDLKKLEEKYARELVVIGVHSPKFENEKDSEAIRQAIMRYEIAHPVVNDANMTIWRKFNVRAWPTLVLIDPQGNYCGYVSGEGNFEVLDTKISELIAFHESKGTLDRTAVNFALERDSADTTPLRYPGKILADEANDRLFISDSNHNRIVITKLDGTLIEIIGSGAIGRRDGTFATAEFDHPHGMALDGQTLYVADTENHLIRSVDLTAKTVSTLAGTGVQGRFNAKGGTLDVAPLNSPWDLLVHNGTLYIAMAGPHQIWFHRLGSNRVGVFAGTGREDITDGPHDSSAFAQPSGLATDGRALFVCDSEGSSIRRVPFDRKEPVTTLVGTSNLPNARSLFEFGDQDGIGANARLQHPLGVVYHGDRLLIADSYNHKIKEIHQTGTDKGEIKTLHGQSKPGNKLDPVEFHEPAGLAIARNVLYVADTNNHRIVTIDLVSGETGALEIAGLTPPEASGSGEETLAETPAVTAPAQKVQPLSPLPLSIQVALPEHYKLNPEFPHSVTVSSGDNLLAEMGKPIRIETRGEGTTIQGEISLQREVSQGTLEVSARFGYCRDGKGGLCKVETVRWTIPVSVASDGAAALQLATTPPKEPAAEASEDSLSSE